MTPSTQDARATGLVELALRCEQATGADRELDIAILTHSAVGYRDIYGDGRMFDRGNDGYWYADDCETRQLPSPTASLDAARALTNGSPWNVADPANGDGSRSVFGYPSRCRAWVQGSPDEHTYAATPALALTAAALRALAASTKDMNHDG